MSKKLKLVDWEKYRKQTITEVRKTYIHIDDLTCDDDNKARALTLMVELLCIIDKLDFNLCKSTYIKGYGPGGKKGPGPYESKRT